MEQHTTECPLSRRPDPVGMSVQFAKRAKEQRKRQKLTLQYLADLTRIDIQRLGLLEAGRGVFKSAEVQLLGVVLGIGLDEVFPLPEGLSQKHIHKMFVSLKKQGLGLIAATAAEKSESLPLDQRAFERSIVHLNYCAECLAEFPE